MDSAVATPSLAVPGEHIYRRRGNGRKYWQRAKEQNIIEIMRADKNAAGFEKRAIKAFYTELADEGESLAYPFMQKAQAVVRQRERFEDDDEEKHGKNESWHTFESL